MPRLFDLLPDNTRKELIAEAKKAQKIVPPKPIAPPPPLPPRPIEQKKQEPVRQFTSIPDFIALDVETTGLEFKTDRIIEIGAVKFVKGKAVGEYSTFVNSGVIIPPHITELTSIKNIDILMAPAFDAIAQELLSFIGTLPLCGHQIEFDLTFINEELKRAGRPELKCQLIDTALLSRVLLQTPTQRFSLKHVSQTLDVNLASAHRALHDARASGEVASLLIPKIADLPLTIRQTMAACAPGSLFKTLVMRTLGNARPMISFHQARLSPTYQKLSTPEKYSEVSVDDVQEYFKENGKLSGLIEKYASRSSQTDMALQVTEAFNSNAFLIAEAGTGTGKSLAYLLPAALYAKKNNCRIIISTRTRNLQDQLVNKDIPLVVSSIGGSIRYSVLKGRSNYVCRNRFQRLLSGDLGNISPRERTAILPLIPWMENTTTGDIEEQNQFNPKWFNKIWNIISADSHDCNGRRCPFNTSCFLQKARQQALSSHLVVINHSLFFSEICSETSFLGKIGAMVFDEAHHLEATGHRHLRVELDTNRLNLFIETVNNLVQGIGELKDEVDIYNYGKELRTILKTLRKRSTDMLKELTAWAQKKHPELNRDYQIAYTDNPFASLVEPAAFEVTLNDIIDTIYHIRQSINGSPRFEELDELLVETQACSDRASQIRADFQYLKAGVTEDHVFWIEGNHEKGWTKLSGVPLNVGDILSTLWERCSGGLVFTSATLSVSKSVDYFKRGSGLGGHDSKTTTAIYKSPFAAHQVIMGGVKTSPEPDSPDYARYLAETIGQLHTSLQKNILVLFTANTMLSSVHEILKANPLILNTNLLAQGASGTRYTVLEQFKNSKQMILLGTDSFWEGIDVPGEACEIVVIPRLPFPVPTHPLTQAVSRRMEELNGESFFSYSVPEAVIKFRQGAGRLIRTTSDRGALIVLDNRIVTKGYGKQFVRSLEGDFLTFEDVPSMLGKVTEFFASDPEVLKDQLKYVPMEDA